MSVENVEIIGFLHKELLQLAILVAYQGCPLQLLLRPSARDLPRGDVEHKLIAKLASNERNHNSLLELALHLVILLGNDDNAHDRLR
jgi:hypothetical protein